MLGKLSVGDKVSGTILLKNYSETTSGKGTKYIRGILHSSGDYPLIVWNSSAPYSVMKEYIQDLIGKVVEVSFEVIDFAGKPSASLSFLKPVEGVEPEEFISVKYNIRAYQKGLLDTLKNTLSGAAYNLYCKIMEVDTGADSIWERFSKEQAAMSYHDNCLGGLLAHTYKCVVLTKYLLSIYPWFGKADFSVEEKDRAEIDLILLGVALHDIGKILEMNNGIYQPESYVTHRIIGLEMLIPHKVEIVAHYGTRGWRMLESIIVGHHHEFDDRARTIYAYTTHLVDKIEADMTGIGQELEDSILTSQAGDAIKWRDGYLSIR